jgi:hypothetical protein
MADTVQSNLERRAGKAELEQCDGCTPRKSTHAHTHTRTDTQNRHPKFWVAYDNISPWGFSGKGQGADDIDTVRAVIYASF